MTWLKMSIFMESSLRLKFRRLRDHDAELAARLRTVGRAAVRRRESSQRQAFSVEADAGIIEVHSYAASVNASVRNVRMICGSIQRDLNFRLLPVKALGAESEILLDLQYHRVPPGQHQKLGCSIPVNDLAVDGDHQKTETSFRIDGHARHHGLLNAWFFGAFIHLHRCEPATR